MLSKYDNIATASEMVEEVMIHGLSTNAEDLSRVSDIFGHSTIEELSFLANDIGRNNEYGEPDPEGTWSSNRRPTRDVFYMILFNIWNWEDATDFWNKYSNPEHKEFKDLRVRYTRLEERCETLEKELKDCSDSPITQEEIFMKTRADLDSALRELEEKDLEIIRLKAKLYDLMQV